MDGEMVARERGSGDGCQGEGLVRRLAEETLLCCGVSEHDAGLICLSGASPRLSQRQEPVPI